MNLRMLYLPHSPSFQLQEGQYSKKIQEIQEILVAKKLLSAKTDGYYTQKTKEALIRFQETAGLPPTGKLDPITYCRLIDGKSVNIELADNHSRLNTILPRANILIIKTERRLTLFDGNVPLRQFSIAIGKPGTPTPVGNFAVATKIINPGGVLGSRWMGLNFDAYGIHGTNAPWLIGKMVSNGCIRMHNPNAEELFALINIGCPVYIRD